MNPIPQGFCIRTGIHKKRTGYDHRFVHLARLGLIKDLQGFSAETKLKAINLILTWTEEITGKERTTCLEELGS